MELPPPLAWLPSYAHSMGGALGCSVTFSLRPTDTPLLYRAEFTFGDRVPGPAMMQVWNLFQMYAAHNGAHPQGRLEREGNRLTVQVAVERRFGADRDDHPVLAENPPTIRE